MRSVRHAVQVNLRFPLGDRVQGRVWGDISAEVDRRVWDRVANRRVGESNIWGILV